MDDAELLAAIEAAYESVYVNPRAISYWTISREYETDDLGETDLLADVIDMACRDSQNDRDARDLDEILVELDPEACAA